MQLVVNQSHPLQQQWSRPGDLQEGQQGDQLENQLQSQLRKDILQKDGKIQVSINYQSHFLTNTFIINE